MYGVKVLLLSGSSGTGHTARQCQSFVSALPEGFEGKIVDLSALDVGHCDGCGACRNGACRNDDGMARIIREFGDADAVVFATPIRFNGPSSMVKTVMDRFQAVWNNPDLIEHRPRVITFMASCGSDNPDLRPCTTIFRSFCLSFGGVWAEPHVFRGTDRSEEGLEEGAAEFAVQISEIVSGSV